MVAMGAGRALCLRGCDRPVGSGGETSGVSRWVRTVGVRGVRGQGRRGVGEDGLGASTAHPLPNPMVSPIQGHFGFRAIKA